MNRNEKEIEELKKQASRYISEYFKVLWKDQVNNMSVQNSLVKKQNQRLGLTAYLTQGCC